MKIWKQDKLIWGTTCMIIQHIFKEVYFYTYRFNTITIFFFIIYSFCCILCNMTLSPSSNQQYGRKYLEKHHVVYWPNLWRQCLSLVCKPSRHRDIVKMLNGSSCATQTHPASCCFHTNNESLPGFEACKSLSLGNVQNKLFLESWVQKSNEANHQI